MSVAIKAEKISKVYQLGEFSTGTISRDIERFWYKLRGKEDPFLKIGEANDRSTVGSSDVVWSLRDINFEINQGEAVGIIGRNGAGKSTLLKVLSRVTTPTEGVIKVKGRIASLLEVGTGFHPELTGRENIFLNGAILGMRKHEIRRKFDEVVQFSGVERYIDTPVKRYSSGMYVRLAFAVAAHLESEILVVDEVLAVGDAEFQEKCLNKMNDVSKGEGRTILFVSHNMDAVRELTSRSIMLKHGQLQEFGSTRDVVMNYLLTGNHHFGILKYNAANWEQVKLAHLLHEVQFKELEILEKETTIFEEGSPFAFKAVIKGNDEKDLRDLSFGMRVMTLDDKPVGTWFSKPDIILPKGRDTVLTFKIPELDLAPGDYYFTVWIGEGDYTCYGKDFDSVNKVFQMKVVPRSGKNVTPVWYSEAWGNVVFKNLIQI